MIKLLRWLQGYVIFESTNGFVERFLNLCKKNNINLWNVKNDGVKVTAFTSSGEFSEISIPAQRSGMDINIVEEHGLPFVMKRHKWRFGAVCGVVLVAVSMILFSCFIWNVEIIPTTGVKIDDFTEKVEELGVKTGAPKSQIDILMIQEELLDSFSQLSWVSLNIFGTKAQIEYTCGKKQQPIVDTETPTNVIAKKNGEIVLVEGYIGENKVKHGELVAEGSLLISGVKRNADMSETLVHATGKVFARTENILSEEVKNSQSFKFVQKTDVGFKLVFFGLNIPLFAEACDGLSNSTYILLKGNETTLPIGFVRKDTTSLCEQKTCLTNEECVSLGLLDCVKQKRLDFNSAELEAVEYSVSEQTDKITVTTHIICVEDIALESPVSVE